MIQKFFTIAQEKLDTTSSQSQSSVAALGFQSNGNGHDCGVSDGLSVQISDKETLTKRIIFIMWILLLLD